MAVTLDQFVKQLEDSGIIAGDTLKNFIPPSASPKDAEELARELVRQKKLTKFQVEEVSKGKAKSLILGNYILMEKIGAGGMGQVFQARHRRMDRFVAVKLLPPATTKNKAAIARFEREVKAAAKIAHPNIVTAYDADYANGVHFLVMELVDGCDLSVLVRKNGPLPVEKALNYVLQAAKGLEAAHAEGIVHRDIKPSNLLLNKKDTVKILDMGLARLSGEIDVAPQAELTSTGTVMGTVDYMAPEQAVDSKTADARADIYALGCSLHFLLTGKPTYEGDSLMNRMLAHRDHPIPSLRAIRPEIPSQLETVFRKMVAKKVQDRYQSMTEVITALEGCGTLPSKTSTLPQPLMPSAELSQTILLNNGKSLETTDAAEIEKAKRPPKQRKKLALLGGVLLGVAMLAVIVVSLKTKDGTLIVEVDQPGATVQVDDKDTVHVSQAGGKGTVSISVEPGKHRLKIEKDGFTVYGQDFEIEAGGKQPISAKLVPVAANATGTTKPPFFRAAAFHLWAEQVAAMTAEKQLQSVSEKLMELNPGFDGKLTDYWSDEQPQITNGIVKEIRFNTDFVTDISPVRVLDGLKNLACFPAIHFGGKLIDLSPLKGMRLEVLNCGGNRIADLSPLAGMELVELHSSSNAFSDLSPLRGMPLKIVSIGGTQVSDLSPLKGMPLQALSIPFTKVSRLSPLRGMKLSTLHCQENQISDLSALQDMPLEFLNHGSTQVSDLSALKGMPLTTLLCYDTPLTDIASLHECKSLKELKLSRTKVAASAVAALQKALPNCKIEWSDPTKAVTDFDSPTFQQWVKDVAAMPAEKQVEAVSKKLVELNPQFDGKLAGWEAKGTPQIENGVVTGLGFIPQNVTDISPLRALTHLKVLYFAGESSLCDLSPLHGMQLRRLQFDLTNVSDLSPLRGMKLIALSCGNTLVSDLSPLMGQPLEALNCPGTQVSDLSPLEGMQLNFLGMNETKISDISPVKGMPLKSISLKGTPVSALSPLQGMLLQGISLDFKPDRDTELLRSIKT